MQMHPPNAIEHRPSLPPNGGGMSCLRAGRLFAGARFEPCREMAVGGARPGLACRHGSEVARASFAALVVA
ncbi:hypothetical protein SAMN05216289_1255 [Dokdonella immobilis]|uniref:Uncharacterized protein n=1 Tax=Dokdonella immobilis TaxID=578942 RepID=A0A1I4ZDQ7_9GAMM|nr:hypothetical protein SAMN05216289_1255 [Dokdonella immobilis]